MWGTSPDRFGRTERVDHLKFEDVGDGKTSFLKIGDII
jgi:hypothetical protein